MGKYGGYKDTAILAELYDLVPGYAARSDIEFYRKECQGCRGLILEAGCGSGRILIPVAKSGGKITGLDISSHMLDKCRQKLAGLDLEIQNSVELVQSNLIEFKLDKKFALVTLPFRIVQHLISIDEQLLCLTNINHHLEIGGRLVFDTFQVDFNHINNPRLIDEVEDFPEIELPDGRKLRRNGRLAAFHPDEQYNDVELIYYLTGLDGATDRIVQTFPFRYYFRYEIEHLLARTGFEIVNIYGNFDKSALDKNSPEMIFEARKIKET